MVSLRCAATALSDHPALWFSLALIEVCLAKPDSRKPLLPHRAKGALARNAKAVASLFGSQ
jgi:hypothetical protein